MNLYMVPLRARHVRRIAPFLREQDQAEALALDGRPAIDKLMAAVDSPTAYAIMDGSVPCGACGVDALDAVAVPWMVGTPRLTSNIREFIKASREVFQDWARMGDVLTNYVHAGNTAHIRWLKWMGFHLGSSVTSPVTGERFLHFYQNVQPSSNDCVDVRPRCRSVDYAVPSPGVRC